jgi:hypothetical protein
MVTESRTRDGREQQGHGDGARHTGSGAGTGHGAGPDPAARTPWGQVAALATGVALLIAVVITAFAWPAVNTAPRGLPVAVVAPPPVVEQVTGLVAQRAGDDALEVTVLPDRSAAEQAVLGREVYGAIVLGPDGGEVLTASAAGPAVAQLLTQLAASIPEEAGGPARVTDLVPLPEDDPRGVGLASAVLPLVIAGIVSGVLASQRVRGTGRRIATVLAVAVLAGVVLTLVLQTWLGAIGGGFWAVSGVLALGAAAIGSILLGLFRVLGVPALVLGAATMVLLGNPLSGVASAPEMLPAGWGQLGQALPPGATGTALRSVAWFDGAGSTTAVTVLAGWLVVGLALALVPRRATAA